MKNSGGKGGRGKKIGAKDLALWKAFTHDIAPFHGAPPADVPDDAPVYHTQPGVIIPPPKKPAPTDKDSRQMDRRTQERFTKGKMEIEGRLDLHGYTEAKAKPALEKFIVVAHAAGKRCVLVITGKGGVRTSDRPVAGGDPGILKRRVPEWLMVAPLSGLVLQYVSARPKDGGAGALYVYLRRGRD